MALLIPTEMVLVFLTAFVNTTSLTFSERALLFKNMLPFKTVDFYFLLLHRAVVFVLVTVWDCMILFIGTAQAFQCI